MIVKIKVRSRGDTVCYVVCANHRGSRRCLRARRCIASLPSRGRLIDAYMLCRSSSTLTPRTRSVLRASLHGSALTVACRSSSTPAGIIAYACTPLLAHQITRIKEKVEEQSGVPPPQQRLIYSGRQLCVLARAPCPRASWLTRPQRGREDGAGAEYHARLGPAHGPCSARRRVVEALMCCCPPLPLCLVCDCSLCYRVFGVHGGDGWAEECGACSEGKISPDDRCCPGRRGCASGRF
jgi:hypothetical protein